jgi:hypothetical protein
MTTKKKRYANAEEYPGDRMTITVHKGYRAWFQAVAKERDKDVSKLAREAFEMWIAANYHTLPEEAKTQLEKLRRAHADSRWSSLL